MSQSNLLIGITGSIAAKKTIDLIRLLQSNFEIKVICTYEGQNYINKDEYKNIDLYETWDSKRKNSYHIELSRWADEFIIYPATANIISKLSTGVADDVLTSTVLMFNGRLKIFPAMHEEMFLNKRIQENLNNLHQDFDVYGPRYGRLDIGDEGLGRLLEPFEVKNTLIPNITDKVYVVSGPTKEYIDDIRYISNRSSGKQGRALALESHARGFDTTLISSINYDDINTIKQLVFSDTKTLLNIINSIDISNGYLFMPAAISDFIPQRTKGKMNRKLGEKKIKLSPNIDIIKEIKNDNPNLKVVGFSAQLNDDINFDKMKEKNLDYLITNDVSNQDIGFDSNNNEVTITDKNANTIHLSLKNKYLIAKEILDHVIK